MDLSKYTKVLKFLSLIPLFIGVLTFGEVYLPNHTKQDTVISKNESHRARFDRTTYTVEFENTDDQFTEEIYNSLSEGDRVELVMTPLHKQIRFITHIESGTKYENDTGEDLAILLFGTVFILCSLVWVKKGNLSKRQAMYVAFIILISIISGIRML